MASMTITTTAQQDARIVAAYGTKLGLGRNATGAEVKEEVIRMIKRDVREQEFFVASTSAQAALTDLGIVT